MIEKIQGIVKVVGLTLAGIASVFLVSRVLQNFGYNGIIDSPYDFKPDLEEKSEQELGNLTAPETPQVSSTSLKNLIR